MVLCCLQLLLRTTESGGARAHLEGESVRERSFESDARREREWISRSASRPSDKDGWRPSGVGWVVMIKVDVRCEYRIAIRTRVQNGAPMCFWCSVYACDSSVERCDNITREQQFATLDGV